MKKMLKTAGLGLLAIAATSVFSGQTAQAGFTKIKAPPAGEMGQLQILQHTYGGSWHEVGDDFYSTNGMSAKRVDDFMSNAGVMSLNHGQIGDATDQTFSAGEFHVRAVAKFSNNSQQFGCGDANGYHSLMNVTGFGFDVSAPELDHNMNGTNFQWMRKGDSGVQSSIDSENADHRDHLATFAINGLHGQNKPVWMMFWEDLNRTSSLPKKRSWADFNDLAVEIRSVNPIPLPPAVWAGLVTMAGALVLRTRRMITA